MADRPTGAGERRDRKLADAEAGALGQAPSPPPPPLAPQPQGSGFFDKLLAPFNVKHTYVGKKPGEK